jgi:hypothetical protein
MNKTLGIGLLSIMAIGGTFLASNLAGCAIFSGEHGIKSIEEMSDEDFAYTKLLASSAIKIAATRMLDEGVVSPDDVGLAVFVLESITTTPVVGTATELVTDLLRNSGLNSVEIEALLEIVVFRLESRGVLENLSEEGLIVLTPRTQEFLDTLIQALSDSNRV